jgi:hypothetical protein
MHKPLLIALLLIPLLTACAEPAPGQYRATPSAAPAPVYDPYTERAAGEQRVQQADAAIQATAAQLTVLGAERDIRLTSVAAEVHATAAALMHEQTRIAPTQAYESTQAAHSYSTAVAPLTLTPGAATAVAWQVSTERDRAQVGMYGWWGFGGFLAVLILAFAIAYVIYAIVAARIARAQVKASVMPGRYGMMVYDWDNGLWGYVPSPPPALQTDQVSAARLGSGNTAYREIGRGVAISYSGASTAQAPNRAAYAMAHALIDAAIDAVGDDANIIPRWDKLPGWSSDKWQTAVGALVSAGAVVVEPNKGTFLAGQYEQLWQLQNALETGAILRHSPAPGG